MEPISVAEHFQGSLLDCDWLKVLEVKVLSQREGRTRFNMAAHSPPHPQLCFWWLTASIGTEWGSRLLVKYCKQSHWKKYIDMGLEGWKCWTEDDFRTDTQGSSGFHWWKIQLKHEYWSKKSQCKIKRTWWKSFDFKYILDIKLGEPSLLVCAL